VAFSSYTLAAALALMGFVALAIGGYGSAGSSPRCCGT